MKIVIRAATLASLLMGLAIATIASAFSQQSNPIFQPGQLIGGGTKQMAVDPSEIGRFLPQPELLTAGGPGKAAYLYINPNVNFASYHKLMVGAVTIWAGPNSQLNGVPADQRLALANAAYADIYNALRRHCQLVRTASPGTIYLHFALVDTKVPNAALNTVATFAPYASAAYSVTSFVFNKGVGYFSGSATGEGFGTDAVNGTLLWQAVDKRGGTTALVANTLDNWRDARHVFQAWGDQLAGRLKEFGVCQ